MNPDLHIVSFSGGKDSTAMLLHMMELGMQIDIVLYCDTWMEFPAMYRHVLNGIKNSFSNIFENVKNVVKGAIDKIKGFFQFKVELPKIKLPHFGISPSGWQIGDLLKGSIPKLGIEWYAKAMDKGMIMNQPTIFGYDSASQNFLAGGEAGSETVVGTQNLMEMIQTAVNSENSILIQFFTKLIALLEDFFPQVLENMGYDLVLDTGALVAETAPQMDEELGKIFKRKGRQ